MKKSPFVMLAILLSVAMARVVLAAEPIRIGWVGPLSAPGAYAGGQEMKWAAELAADEINRAGGVLGRPLELVYEDTRGMPEQGTAAMERLITGKKVVAVFGEFHSSVGLAEIEVAHKYGIPFIASEVWADDITARQYPEVFRVAPANSMIYDIVAAWVVAAGFKNVAIMQETTDWGVGAVKVLTQKFDQHGVKYSVTTVELTQQDFTAQILRFMNQKPRPDLFMNMLAGEGSYRITRQSCELGFTPTPQTALYSGGSPSLYPEFWENVGECGVYLMAELVGLPKALWNDKTRAFIEAFKQRFNRTPSAVGMEAYDSLYLLVEAIRKTGTTDPKALIQALETLRWTGTRGEYWFSTQREPAWAYHQFLDAPVVVIQYDRVNQGTDEARILWPRRWATTEALYLKVKK
ncbi:MAG: amino acid ABC transporter substrate-binding protein [Candidatus Tectimicrobiota bacterium]|nr:MAG: amino acid ABC transporter substrate-binding protein [Candidatus Tectomicrobia bacterium]